MNIITNKQYINTSITNNIRKQRVISNELHVAIPKKYYSSKEYINNNYKSQIACAEK